jgi:hypothetical protein
VLEYTLALSKVVAKTQHSFGKLLRGHVCIAYQLFNCLHILQLASLVFLDKVVVQIQRLDSLDRLFQKLRVKPDRRVHCRLCAEIERGGAVEKCFGGRPFSKLAYWVLFFFGIRLLLKILNNFLVFLC